MRRIVAEQPQYFCQVQLQSQRHVVWCIVITALAHLQSSAWWGFTTSDDRRRIEGFLRRGIRAGFYRTGWPAVENLVEDADDDFFRRVLHDHVLHPLLPERHGHEYVLRRRRHERTLTSNDDKRNFIFRQLHK